MDSMTNDFDLPFDPRVRTKVIAACGLDYEIGVGNRLPWKHHHEGDTDFFRKETMGQVVLMGRKTWETFPEDQVGDRHFVILSETINATKDRISFVSGWEPAIRESVQRADQQCADVYIAGGESVYEQAFEMGLVDEVNLTVFSDTYPADAYFPEDYLTRFEIEEYRPIEDNKPGYPEGSYRAYLSMPGIYGDRKDLWLDRAETIRKSN